MSVPVLALGSIVAVGAVSLSGIFLLTIKHKTLSKLMLLLIGFSTGAILGDVFLHMLPEVTEGGAEGSRIWFTLLGGIVASFILEKFIHWHHCHTVECEEHVHPIGIMNIVGDLLHNAIDGVLIASSYMVSVEVGVATTVAVVLHEIPQEIGDVSILLHSGFSRSKAVLLNVATALSAVLAGGIILLLGSSSPAIIEFLLPFAAGNFLYIAGADLIPELHKETGIRRSIVQLIGLLAGIAAMALLMFAE